MKFVVSYFISLLSILSLLTFSACSFKADTNTKGVRLQSDSSQIINGRPVTLSDSFYKHTVAIGPEKEPFCTGVLISKDSLITAGHCAEDLLGTYVHFGLDYAGKTAVRLKIVKVTPHPDYCDSCAMSGDQIGNPADISVVQFQGQMPPDFSPVEFAQKSDIVDGKTVILAGYGMNEKQDYETIMKVTSVPIKLVGDTEFATNETKNGSCNGDSGGPAFIEIKGRYLLAGITSRGDEACRRIGIYTIPVTYNQWILEEATKPETNH